MSLEQKCCLCEKTAKVTSAVDENKDANRVGCETCGIYYLGSPTLFEKDYKEMPREKKAMLSAYTREQFELGKKPPELGDTDALEGIIAEYENKSDDEKLENLIWYIRKGSPQFGDSIEFISSVNYPIVYGLEENDYLQKLASAVDKGLVHPIRGRYEEGIKLTRKGWRRGTELMEERGGGSS